MKWDQVKRQRADVAWLKAAYMVTFATWGYMYAFAPGLKIVQRQLDRYDEEIIPHFKLTNVAASRKSRGLRPVARHVDEVQIDSAEGHHELTQLIEPRFMRVPVVPLAPVCDERLHVTQIGAVAPADLRLVWPPHALETSAEVRQYVFGNVNRERLRRRHGLSLSEDRSEHEQARFRGHGRPCPAALIRLCARPAVPFLALR